MIAIDEKSLLAIKDKVNKNKNKNKNNNKLNNVRIYFSGVGCDGPNFDITLDELKSDDLVYKIDDLTFLLSQYEYMQYGDIKIDSSEESLKITPESLELSMCCGKGCPDCPY